MTSGEISPFPYG